MLCETPLEEAAPRAYLPILPFILQTAAQQFLKFWIAPPLSKLALMPSVIWCRLQIMFDFPSIQQPKQTNCLMNDIDDTDRWIGQHGNALIPSMVLPKAATPKGVEGGVTFRLGCWWILIGSSWCGQAILNQLGCLEASVTLSPTMECEDSKVPAGSWIGRHTQQQQFRYIEIVTIHLKNTMICNGDESLSTTPEILGTYSTNTTKCNNTWSNVQRWRRRCSSKRLWRMTPIVW